MALRLQGASEMVAHWLIIHGKTDEDKEMGRRLLAVTDWFMDSEGDPWKAPPVLPPATKGGPR